MLLIVIKQSYVVVNNYKNLQPLCSKTNRCIKRGNIY